MIAEDPQLQQEVNRLRQELNDYADAYDIAPPPSGRGPRTPEEFQDLDHEMINAMVERNHTLNIWRYVLLAACLLLIGVSGYLFRLKEEFRADLITERALHAQDAANHQLELADTRELAHDHVDSLTTLTKAVAGGAVRVHFLPWARVALVDLAGAPPPPTGHSYFIYTAGKGHLSSMASVVMPEEQENWRTIRLTDNQREIRIYDWETAKATEPKYEDSALAVILLP